MGGIMAASRLLRYPHEFCGDQLKPLAFEPRDYSARQVSLHGVRLDND